LNDRDEAARVGAQRAPRLAPARTGQAPPLRDWIRVIMARHMGRMGQKDQGL
jgi:hypothetical protein